RYMKILDPELVMGAWTKEEDDKVTEPVGIYGAKNWDLIARHLKGRRDKQCRERWHYHLKPELKKSSWTPKKDLILYKAHSVPGNWWAAIAKLPGRTDNSETGTFAAMDLKGKKNQNILKLKEAASPTVKKQTGSRGGGRLQQSPPKSITDAVLRMVAEDMLPLSFVESSGFRNFMAAIGPQYPRLSQRTIGLKLYDDVEKVIKPQLIRKLKSAVAVASGDAMIHVGVNLWSSQGSDRFVAVQLHFIDDDWNVQRPTVAFRHINGANVNAAVAREAEAVLLSYGLFPDNIGYIINSDAKSTITAYDLFCDYKVMCSRQKSDPDEDDLVRFLSDVSPGDCFSEISFGARAGCIVNLLQQVMRDALENSWAAENVLQQVHGVVAFFRSSAYWNEVLVKESGLSFAAPYNPSSYRWNSMLVCVRRMLQEAAWRSVMSVLALARTEAKDSSCSPPQVRARREQVLDVIGLLEPFEEAIQVLQHDGVTFSLVIPTLICLDKSLQTRSTSYTLFCKGLRAGLHAHFQPLLLQRDLILATVLDPRIKLQPFGEGHRIAEDQVLVAPSKYQAQSVLEFMLVNHDTLPTVTKGQNLQFSEVDQYLAEPLMEGSTSPQAFWKAACRFPQLQNICRWLLAIPAASGGFDRLFPMAICILRARRNRLAAYTTERLLLYKESVKTKTEKLR
uniref:Uncharacterized protein n=1 Tax=Denticeps clupeoides TaxID=299321 RepID=A0AAY4B7I9_9TELE